ncbi:MAG: hypothetical protein KDC94_06255 [Aequorivita sp.]|nr:hypothetical protein [Aequorivita sp.]
MGETTINFNYVHKIDKSGRTLRISLYNADGNLTENSGGIAEYFYYPELYGLFYLEKQLNANAEEIARRPLKNQNPFVFIFLKKYPFWLYVLIRMDFVALRIS